MARVAPQERKRAYRPKTRTGCLTCKYRRIKCSEERPACSQCTSTSRVCDGYENPAPAQSSSLTATRLSSHARRLIPRSFSTPSLDLFGGEEERRSFQFFIAKTAPQLAGDFECAFWERLLLQSVHHEPAIRHVTVALGSLHECFERNAGNPTSSGSQAVQDSFALRQYLRAVRCLTSSTSGSQPLDVCLIACILFACFEAMRGQSGSAITHITSGLKILDELRTSTMGTSVTLSVGRTPYVPLEIVCGLFTRLQAQITVDAGSISDQFARQTVHRRSVARCNLWPELVIDPNRPMVFHSLADARETLEIYTYYYRQRSTELRSENAPAELPSVQEHTGPTPSINSAAVNLRDTSMSLLAQWSIALDRFLRARGAPLTERERRAVAILQLRKLDYLISLDIFQPAGQAEAGDHVQWDRYCSFFAEMATLAESIVPLPSSASPGRNCSCSVSPPKTFSLDLGIIAAMFNVAVRCRDPHIRRRAVGVLRASAVQEGIWNSAVVAAIAEKWIEIEEEGLEDVTSCADVPTVARLSDFLPIFDAEEPRALVYFSRSAMVSLGSARAELFRW
ncbi:Zn(II)2Cys6 transcription factor [Aspergillus saccharolyticus JOP 1030-1]|uniref:Zn(2)-C6 fungal-type domain-containing protein n=1 Tax=Aspergillus saccharolyticus JOP 1030-1 TaxID=1450539 RepID=A0A318YZE1_9EURO|nr:hypothetical protein BP01DRAFT_308553 [Aspergillus saccharolyticus JOP 1030-1]PYH40345.1 hypothetical protein BP01DRAFT_308553 [Aspergillus saccharolyticus JOP 1030-1]